MNAIKFQDNTLDRIISIMWGLVLVCLPVTTFNFFPSFFSASQTRPLSLYPLAILLPLLLIRQVIRKEFRFSIVLLPLILFLMAAFFSSIWGFQFFPANVHGRSYLMQMIKAWLSVGIGLGFFYAAFSSVRSQSDLETTIKWLFAGFILSAVVGLIQVIAIQTDFLKFPKVHSVLSTFLRQTYHPKRIDGLTFEPSWFADQMVILYLPWLLASFFFKFKLTGKRILDVFLFLILCFLLIFTYSRSGILNAGISVVIALLLSLPFWWKRFTSGITQYFSNESKLRVWMKRILLVLIIICILAALVFAMMNYSYFINIFDFQSSESLVDYIMNISFGPRAGYALAGFEVYTDHPVFGVGWGGSGLLIYEEFPDWLKTFSNEIEHFYDPAYNVVPNPKNMYVRLLAETGLVGFWLYAGFHLSILGQVVRLFKQKDAKYYAVGFAGLLIWLLVSVRYLTMDSMASPNSWIGFGIILGIVFHLPAQQDNERNKVMK